MLWSLVVGVTLTVRRFRSSLPDPQPAAALAGRGQDIAVAHTAEVLDASIRGRPL